MPAPRVSAGTLIYRIKDGKLRVLLARPVRPRYPKKKTTERLLSELDIANNQRRMSNSHVIGLFGGREAAKGEIQSGRGKGSL